MSSQKFMHLSLTSPQLALAASFDANDLSEFNRALRNGANVNLRDRDARYTVFELACKTPGKKPFIRACLNHGAVLSEVRMAWGFCLSFFFLLSLTYSDFNFTTTKCSKVRYGDEFSARTGRDRL
uniref:Uncharacterized protein n=1 Tax=Anopheles merus TaxID=30066 RepID=A0A182UP52_ANOME